MLIFSTFFLNIVLEQMIIIFRKFFVHMDFWMIELFIVAFLNKKIYKIQIYKHQKMAFIFIFISIFFNLLTVILTISEKNEEKALYVGNIYSIIIASFIFCYYAFFLYFSFISVKELIDLNIISINIILFIYGIFGSIFCILFYISTTFYSVNSNNNNYIANFLFKVKEYNSTKSYIDNFKI